MTNPRNQRVPYEQLSDDQFHEKNCSACIKGTPTASCPGYTEPPKEETK